MDSLVKKFIMFREGMGLGLSLDLARYIWGRKKTEELSEDTKKLLLKKENNLIGDEKVKYFKENYNSLLVFDWVKFIGISGSVASGFAKEDDDIDVFIVVRDGCLWLYRGVLTLRGLFNGLFRKADHGSGDVKNKFCLNFIVEESGLVLDSDIFNFHELMVLKPVYNEKYLNCIYSQNDWLVDEYFVKKELLKTRIRKESRVNFVIRFVSWLSFWFQFLYMFVFRHRPNLKRLRENTKKGRIEFFPEGFKKDVLRIGDSKK